MKLESAIDLAIRNTFKEGLSDIFPEPFETELLSERLFRGKLRNEIKTRILSNSLSGLKAYPLAHVLFPKKNAYDFRRAALIDPLDSICYLALVLTFADTIEKSRIAKSKKTIYSYRLNPKLDYLFDDQYNYSSFQSRVTQKSKNSRVKILVKCDIASFYDRMNLHRLESTLLSIGVDKGTVSLTNELLLFWANRDSYSIPIGGNASRILAEAALLSVDDFLHSHKVNFCRYVDDFRFFAPDAKTAHSWLALLVERLYLEGLTINSAKTSIEFIKSAHDNSQKDTQKPTKSRSNRIIVGYSGTIPLKFRELSEKETKSLSSLSIGELEQELFKNEILQPDDIKKFLKVLVATHNYERLPFYSIIAEKFPQFTPYLIDILIKKKAHISDVRRLEISNYFKSFLFSNPSHPEYLLICILRLLGTNGYTDKNALLEFWRSLKRNSGAYVGRAVLEALQPLVSRTDVLEIRQYFARADNWEKRAIIKIADTVLSEKEKRPWLKNIKVHFAHDHFGIEIFEPSVKSKKKAKKKSKT